MKIGRLWPASKRRSDRPTIVAVDSEMGLEAFGLESEPSTSSGKPTMIRASGSSSSVLQTRRLRTVLVIAVGLMAMAGGYWFRDRLSLGRPATGSITFETQPAGLEVFVSGRSVGRTPVTLALPPGPYDVRLGAGPATRAARVAVVSGTSVVQHYEMPPAPAPPSTTGSVRVQTEPAGLAVLLDGFDHGSSPASLEHVPAGDHEIAVRVGDALVKRAVHVVAGEATSVIITSAARAEPGLVAVGWLAVKCPVAVQIREAGHVIGASELDRMMMPSGEHDLEFVSDALVFRTTRRVKIAAGKVTATQIDVPDGKMNLNAQPWAEVFVDGERVGLTPIGNLSRAIGRHEVVFRHPDLGERRAFITVTTQETARLGVDLRKP